MSYPQEFEDLWKLKPNRKPNNNKKLAYKQYLARIKEYSYEEIKEGTIRWAKCMEAMKLINTPFVMQFSTFLGPNCHFEDDWEIPESNEKPAWAKVPAGDDDMLPWAHKHGYPSSGQMTYFEYRRFLHREVEKRMERENN